MKELDIEFRGRGIEVPTGVRRGDNKDLSYATSDVSVSHTIGNALAYVREKILSQFKDDYFNTVNVSTKIAFRHFNILDNKHAQFNKKMKPYLIIRPRIDPNSEGSFLDGTMLTSRYVEGPMVDRGALIDVIRDAINGVYLEYQLTRFKVSYDITIMVETPNEQLDLVHKLKHRMVWNKHLTWSTFLETFIPQSVMAGISYVTNIPLSCPSDMLTYMNTNSTVPITYKMKNGSGVDEYFAYQPVNIDAHMSNISMDDGSRTGMVDEAYTVSFTIDTEFNGVGSFYLFTKDPLDVNELDRDWLVKEPQDYTHHIEQDRTALRLDVLLTDLHHEYDIPVGWQLYSNPSYMITERDKYKPDILELQPIITHDIDRALQYHIDRNIPLTKMIKIDIYRDGKIMSIDRGDYYIDFPTRKVFTYLKNIHSNYRMVILINKLYLNELMIDILGREGL